MHDHGQLQPPSKMLPPLNQIPTLVMSSSNVSTSTLDSELVSPNLSQEAQFHVINQDPVKSILRDSTSPSITAISEGSAYTTESPVLNVGSKRTAAGTIKQSSPTRGKPLEKADSNKRHSAFELSADLRTRLKYAMLKVQNGWESQNIQQLEQLQVASPKTVMGESPSRWSRRDSTSSTEAYLVSPIPATGARPHDSSRLLQRQLQFPPAPTFSYQAPPSSTTNAQYVNPRLAPPAQISSPSSSSSHRRSKTGSISSRFGPQLGRSSGSKRGRSGTTTSTASPARGIHTKAEKDAVDSLLFMSSPVNAGGARARGRANTFSAGVTSSPSRPEKRVDFVR